MRRRLASCHPEMVRALDNEQRIVFPADDPFFRFPMSADYQPRYCYQTS